MNDLINKEKQGVRTWVEIDTKAIEHNYKTFRSLIAPNVKLCAVVKANAYGHDFVAFAREVVKLGVDQLAVDSVTEFLRLREEGIKVPIFILGYTLPERIQQAVEADCALTISQFENLEYIAKEKYTKPVSVHIKVDTGMHRQGFLKSDAEKLFTILKNNPQIIVAGVYSHFASAGSDENAKKTEEQINNFSWWKDEFTKQGFKPLFHMSASAGTLSYPQSHHDMVRVGMGLYGCWPSNELKEKFGDKIKLKPILSWKTLISEVKKIPKGESIGYDFTETLTRDSVVAVCPIGYWHGYPRALSSQGEVLINGKRAKVLGRVSMSMIVVDVTDVGEVSVHDEVVLIGSQGNEMIEAMEIAEKLDASWYELLTRLNPMMRRIYI